MTSEGESFLRPPGELWESARGHLSNACLQMNGLLWKAFLGGYGSPVSIPSISAVTSVSTTPVYALSPFLNGIRRLSDADRDVADVAGAAATSRALAVQGATTARPAIGPTAAQLELASQTASRSTAAVAIGTIAATTALAPTTAVVPAVAAPALIGTRPIEASLTGDSGLLVQSHAAALFATGRLAVPPLFAAPLQPAIPPVERTGRIERVSRLDVYA